VGQLRVDSVTLELVGSAVPEHAIRFQAVRFAYDGQVVLGPLDLTIEAGETVVLLGRSGSGKTTALKLVNRLLEPRTGTVVVRGRATTEWDPVRLRRAVGYVIQEVGLFPHLTVGQNVELVPRLEGWAADRRRARVRELLQMVGLDPERYHARLPAALSGGQRQRVGVARALAADPPILLCDEPFGAVDPITRAELQREFRALVARLGTTVLFVTHDVREALLVGDRVVVMEDGQIRFAGTPEAFRTSPDDTVERLRGLA
jgi:osmoprotectant transport system ATP-binding protein